MRKTLIVLICFAFFSCAPTRGEMPPPNANDGGADWAGDATAGPGATEPGTSGSPQASTEKAGRYATPPPGVTRSGAWEEQDAADDDRAPASQPSSSADLGAEWGSDALATRDRGRGKFGSRGQDALEDTETEASAATPMSAPAGDFAPRASSETRRRNRSSASVGPGGGGAVAQKSGSAVRPLPEERPGLGTSWGETRYSPVGNVMFERDSSRPNYAASIHYNDARGARALVGRGYWSTTASVNMSAALTVTVRNERGSTLPAYRGNGRTVAVGANGQRYTILVHNRTNERFELVLSVDGLDVLDGRTASYSKRGYVVAPYGTIEIDGFRQSDDSVAAFRFGSVKNSYAAQTGSARNVGVIGVAAFGERGYYARLQAYRARIAAQRVSQREVGRRLNADPFPNRYATPPLNLVR